jgi:hypothetical protein
MCRDAIDEHRVVDAQGQQGFGIGRRQLAKEAERDVRGEREARLLVAQTTRLDAFVQRSDRAIGIEREHDDVRLHEAHGRQEPQRHWRGITCDRFERSSQLVDSRSRRNRPHSRGSGEREMWRDTCGESRIEFPLNLEDALTDRAVKLGENDDPGFQASMLSERRAKVERERAAVGGGGGADAEECAVDKVAGVLMVPVHDLQARKRSNRSAGDDVAGPVLIVEHA